MRITLTAIVLLTFSLSLPKALLAADISYKILINGIDADVHHLEPSDNHTLEVWGIVTNNDIVPGTPGGFLQASFDLLKDSKAVEFDATCGFLCSGKYIWDSFPNDAFGESIPGRIDANGNVIQETLWFFPAQWGTRFNEVGTEVFDIITSGEFEYDGTSTTSITLRTAPEVNLVATLKDGDIGAAIPDGSVSGDSVLIHPIPEPTTLLLTVLGLISFATQRRRS